jgi:hypothetical protein
MASLSVYKIKHVRESFKVLECQIEGHLTETTVYHLDFSIWISLARRRLRQGQYHLGPLVNFNPTNLNLISNNMQYWRRGTDLFWSRTAREHFSIELRSGMSTLVHGSLIMRLLSATCIYLW